MRALISISSLAAMVIVIASVEDGQAMPMIVFISVVQFALLLIFRKKATE